jgi:mono/diheme cytochrome c family protein
MAGSLATNNEETYQNAREFSPLAAVRKALFRMLCLYYGSLQQAGGFMPNREAQLPVRGIAIGMAVLFVLLVSAFLVVPAFFDVQVGGSLFETPEQPWMVSDEFNARYQMTVNEQKGRYQFQQYCASCHGPWGSGGGPQSAGFGGRIPDLSDPGASFVNGMTAEALRQTIDEGLPGRGMPAFPHIANHVKDVLVDFMLYVRANRHLLGSDQQK